MQKLLDDIEQYGFRDADGHLLTNCRQWHELRLAAKLIEARTGPAVNDATERAIRDAKLFLSPSASELTQGEIKAGGVGRK